MKYIFTNGHILDGTKDMKVLDGHSVLVEDDKITGIVKGNTVPDGFKEINLEGKYLMPGLINMHVHLAGNGKPQKKQRDNEKTVKLLMGTALSRAVTYNVVKDFAKTELMSGVTTIRTVGGLADFDTRVRDDIRNGKADGPEYLQLMKEFLCRVDIWLVQLQWLRTILMRHLFRLILQRARMLTLLSL